MSLDQMGLTLLEILIALALGTFIIAVSLQIYVSSKQSYRVQNASSILQENARFGLESIAYEARMAGSFGCVNLGETGVNALPINNTLGAADEILSPGWTLDRATALYPFMLEQSLEGFESPLLGTEALVIIRGERTQSRLIADMVSRTDDIETTRFDATVGDVIVISDCIGTDIVKIGKITHTAQSSKITHRSVLSRAYAVSSGAMVQRLSAGVYYVSGDASKHEYTVRRHDLAATSTGPDPIIANGVRAMNLRIGIGSTDGLIDRFLQTEDFSTDGDPSAPQAMLRNQVISVEIEFLMESTEDNLMDVPEALTFDEEIVNGDQDIADRRMREIFRSYVSLRNRVAWE